ncbi:MAG TPA: CPBP family glutamic-type intramembrane protease, partial [Gemmataceae bacterium]|nr:CPBP family glutamic-type intramembrane protease [Gemmataceae bacterium]
YWAPVLIVIVFVVWSSFRRWDHPAQLAVVWKGMILESLVFAWGLFVLSRVLGPWIQDLGIRLSAAGEAKGLGQIITFVGAGIYEELLFRLLLFLGLGCLFRLAGISRWFSAILSTLTSAALFAAAHHVGPYGEVFDRSIFLFRVFAGLYFALLYQLRGFGIAVGTHTCYDLLVGVLMV